MSLIYNLDDLRPSWRIDFKGPVHPVLGTHCWLWHKLRTDGYGTGTAVHGKSYKAHRAVYLKLGLTIPPKHDLDHLCRNRGCVNPHHLQSVTRAENLRRSMLTGPGQNIRKRVCKRGHDLALAHVWTDGKGITHRQCRICIRLLKRGVAA